MFGLQPTEVTFTHFHIFCGLGGGARGFNRGRAEVGSLRARFRCIGGIDVNPQAIRDFQTLAGVPGTVLDLFDREQYRDFHGHEPPPEWREATPEDIRKAAGYEHPNIVFSSSPCKGFSGLLSESKSKTAKYQALNRLTVRGIWLMLEAFADNLPELVIFENVPRIATRGRHLLDQINALLRQYGYAVAETVHDCGEIGGLAQSRKRFLMVARHTEKVRPFLYEPPTRPLRSVGSVLEQLPLPGDPAGGPMHSLPSLQWKTWVRLALIEAGSDWRSLNRLRIVDGKVADYLIMPGAFGDVLGVIPWTEPMGAISGRGGPTNGAYSVADPRAARDYYENTFRVVQCGSARGTITPDDSPTNGGGSVADPRFSEDRHKNVFTVVPWKEARGTVTSGHGPSCGGGAVADPRFFGHEFGQYGVRRWDQPMGTVTGQGAPGQGPISVADPRVPWDAADTRNRFTLPNGTDNLVAVIKSATGDWHRPFTTLELAVLQNLIDPDDLFTLDGTADHAWRERIGNAVPSGASQAIANVMGETLLLQMAGETFQLSAQPIWVRPIAVALSVDTPAQYIGTGA